MSEFQKLAVVSALLRMFAANGYFDICTIDSCLKIVGVTPDAREYQAMRLIHCVHWKDVPAEMRTEAIKATASMFGFGANLLSSGEVR